MVCIFVIQRLTGCGSHHPFDKLRKLVTAPPVTLLPRGDVNSALLIFSTVFFFLFLVLLRLEPRALSMPKQVRSHRTVSSALIL